MELDIISTDVVKITSSYWYNYSRSSTKHTHTAYNHSVTTTNNHNDTNATSSLSRDENIAVAEMAVSATILFLAIVGNSCVVFALANKRKRQSRMHLMILHLSLADLFVAFFNVLPQLIWDITYRFEGGPVLCVLVKYLQVVAMYASSYVLLATAIDRYYAICHPFASQSWTAKHAHALVIIAWTASLFFSLPQMFIFSYREVEQGTHVYDCWASFQPEWTLPAYITWMTASVFVVPTCLLGILYGKITWVVWKAGRLEEKLIPAKLTPLGPRRELFQGPCGMDRHLQSATPTTMQSGAVTTNYFNTEDKRRCSAQRALSQATISDLQGGILLEIRCKSDKTSVSSSKDLFSEYLKENEDRRTMPQSSSFENEHDVIQENPDRQTVGSLQLNGKNSTQMRQNPGQEPLTPLAHSRIQSDLIMEYVSVIEKTNETNLDKHNHNVEKDVTVVHNIPRCVHPSAAIGSSNCLLDGKVVLVSRRCSVGTNVSARPQDAHPEANKHISTGTVSMCRLYNSWSVSVGAVHILLSDPCLTERHPEDKVKDVPGPCTERDVLLQNGLSNSVVGPDVVIMNETGSISSAKDFTTLDSACLPTDMNSARRAKLAYFGLSDQTEEDQRHLFRNSSNNMCNSSRGSLMDCSGCPRENSFSRCRSTNGSNNEYDQHVSQNKSLADEFHKQQFNNGKADDMLENEHDNETEYTISTLGSLNSLNLLETTDLGKLNSFIPEGCMSCDDPSSVFGDETYSNSRSTTQQQLDNYPTTVTSGTPTTFRIQESICSRRLSQSPGNKTVSSTACNDVIYSSELDNRNPNFQPGNCGISKAKLKTIKLTLTVVICYVLCWAPFFVGQMWAAYDINAPFEGPFFSIIMLLASVNSCTNPWIYTIFSNTICQRIRDIFRIPCGCLATCWKLTKSFWSRKNSTPACHPMSVHDETKDQRIFEHNSFSILG